MNCAEKRKLLISGALKTQVTGFLKTKIQSFLFGKKYLINMWITEHVSLFYFKNEKLKIKIF